MKLLLFLQFLAGVPLPGVGRQAVAGGQFLFADGDVLQVASLDGAWLLLRQEVTDYRVLWWLAGKAG